MMSLSLEVLVSDSLRTAVCGVRSAFCGLRSVACGLRSVVCGLRSAVYSLQMSDTAFRVPWKHSKTAYRLLRIVQNDLPRNVEFDLESVCFGRKKDPQLNFYFP